LERAIGFVGARVKVLDLIPRVMARFVSATVRLGPRVSGSNMVVAARFNPLLTPVYE